MASPQLGCSYAQSDAKRRKVRKGTHSCWECKRRKMKCIFESPSNSICNGCQQRGCKCISQEFPEEVSRSLDRSHDKRNRAMRLATVDKRLGRDASTDNSVDHGRTLITRLEDKEVTNPEILTPVSTRTESPQYLSFYESSRVSIQRLYLSITDELVFSAWSTRRCYCKESSLIQDPTSSYFYSLETQIREVVSVLVRVATIER